MSSGMFVASSANYELKRVNLRCIELQRLQDKYAKIAQNLSKGYWSVSMLAELPFEYLGYVMNFQEQNFSRSMQETTAMMTWGYNAREKMGYCPEWMTTDMPTNWNNTLKKRLSENAKDLIAMFQDLEAEVQQELKLLENRKTILEGMEKFGDKLSKESAQKAVQYMA